MIIYQLSSFHKRKEPIVISKADRAERIFKKTARIDIVDKKDGERREKEND